MVTVVPPAVGPPVGEMLVTVGAAKKVNWSALLVADVPPGVVTVTSTVPAVWAGDVTVMVVPLPPTVKVVTTVLPKLTAVAPVKLLPVMVTLVPPAIGPPVGETPVTVGAAKNVNWSALLVADVPPTVVTVTSTVPAASAGVTAVIVVALTTVKLAADTLPNLTALAPVKPVPVIVTLVPPAVGPLVGDTAVTVGAAT
jgi:hypothetical protein